MDIRTEVHCDDCGKDILTLGNQGVHCDYCFEDLKDTISNLEDKIYTLENKIEKSESEQ